MELNEAILCEIVEHQGNPCVSMVISTMMTSFDDKEKIQLKFKKNINQVSKLLHSKYDEDIALILVDTIKSVLEKVDLKSLPKGIGVYATPGFYKFLSFQFPVKDSLVVDKAFDVSLLLQSVKNSSVYVVLAISKNMARLFSGSGSSFFEITDLNFPYIREDQFQVHRADTHSFYNEEESKINQARLERYFRDIDQLLDQYIDGHSLILIGVQDNLSLFRSISKHKDSILGEKHGNFDKHSLHQVKEVVEPMVQFVHKA